MLGEVCVYVGESSNIPYRITQHVKAGEKKFDSYVAYFCDDRKRLEPILINLLRPKYNVTYNNHETNIRENSAPVLMEISRGITELAHAIKLKEGEAIPVGRDDLEHTIGQSSRLYNPDIVRIAKKYAAYLGDGKDGLPRYDLQMILRFRNEIRHDIDKEESSQISY